MINSIPYNSFPASTAQFEEGKNDAIQAEIDAIQAEIDAIKDGTNIDSFGDVETALATKTDISNIAPTFDSESGTYEIGEQVIYDGVLYEFTSPHSTAGEWDSSEVQAVKISELIDTLKSGLTNVNSNLSSKQNATDNNLQTTDKTVVGAINEVKSGLIGEVVSITTGVTLYKQGKFRMLVVYGAKSTRDGIIAIIPASDKPASQFIYPSMFVENNTTKAGSLQINANGNVHIRSYDDVLKDNCPVYGSYCYYII